MNVKKIKNKSQIGLNVEDKNSIFISLDILEYEENFNDFLKMIDLIKVNKK